MTNATTITASVGTQNHVASQIGQDDNSQMTQRTEESSKSEGTQAGGTLQQTLTPTTKTASTGTITRSKDYNDEMTREAHEMHHNMINNNTRRSKSKSTEDMNVGKLF